MKKRTLKALCRKALAVAVGAALMVQAYVPTIASAEEETKTYISEVYLSYGDTDEQARSGWRKTAILCSIRTSTRKQMLVSPSSAACTSDTRPPKT